MTDIAGGRPFTAAAFNQYLSEHQLMLARCAQCGAQYAPPRAICPACHGSRLEWRPASGQATLAAFTIVYAGPTFMVEQGFDRKTPYVSAIVTLAEGASLSARLTGCNPLQPDSIRIGAPLAVDFIDFGQGDARRTYLAFKAV